MNRYGKENPLSASLARSLGSRWGALAFSAVAILALQPGAAGEDTRFEYEYRPVALPERSAPQWALMQRAGTPTVEDGKLVVHVTAGNRHYYAIGVNNEGTPFGDAEAWSLSGGKMTVDFRLKVQSAAPEIEAFRISLSDGALSWPVIFRQGEVEKKPLPDREADTYRITVDNGSMILSSSRLGIIKERSKGLTGGGTPNPMIYFGTFATNKEWPQQHGAAIDWELEFVRWTPAVLPPLGVQ